MLLYSDTVKYDTMKVIQSGEIMLIQFRVHSVIQSFTVYNLHFDLICKRGMRIIYRNKKNKHFS